MRTRNTVWKQFSAAASGSGLETSSPWSQRYQTGLFYNQSSQPKRCLRSTLQCSYYVLVALVSVQIHVTTAKVEVRKNAKNKQLPSIEEFIRWETKKNMAYHVCCLFSLQLIIILIPSLSLRIDETRRKFHLKFGDVVLSDDWSTIIESLAIAAIKFEFLSTGNTSPVSCMHKKRWLYISRREYLKLLF